MTPEQFCYWLQGFAEINHAPPSEEQWKAIKEHLQIVFMKVTPQYVPPAVPVVPLPLGPITYTTTQGIC